MSENLKTTKYSNGDAIPNVTNNTSWAGLTSGAYCWYNNDAVTYKNNYGALYNFYAVTDTRNICPTGWRVPSDAEWTILTNYLTNNEFGYEGSGSDIAKAMATTSGWSPDVTAGNAGNDQASNSSGGFCPTIRSQTIHG
ncbi:MAG: fibrobacter succinogenes major paralogous domain-containing protein [Ignavibacteriales bacterium]|nr:fibrobacter succinogenes major paralogous domain-containing protein [Ignavibacteriales bacterium]